MEPTVLRHPFRIVMGEVDVAQIHFTTLFQWMDRGLSEWLALVGYPFTRLLEEGPGVPIVDVGVSIQKRIHLDDVLELTTWMGEVGTTSFRSFHRFTRGDETVASGRLVHVCVDRATRATQPVPAWLRQRAAPAGWEPAVAPTDS